MADITQIQVGSTTYDIAVKGLGTAAYSATTDFAAASHTHSYLPIQGGTLSGNLGISKDYRPTLAFKDDQERTLTYIYTDNNRIYFNQKPVGQYGDNREVFSLPAPASELSDSPFYAILTSKNTVTIAQGGTGATSANAALKNLTPTNLKNGNIKYVVTQGTDRDTAGYSSLLELLKDCNIRRQNLLPSATTSFSFGGGTNDTMLMFGKRGNASFIALIDRYSEGSAILTSTGTVPTITHDAQSDYVEIKSNIGLTMGVIAICIGNTG